MTGRVTHQWPSRIHVTARTGQSPGITGHQIWHGICVEQRPGSLASRNKKGKLRQSNHSKPQTPRRVIGRQIALGFFLVAAVAIVMCGMLLTRVTDLSNLVQAMRQDEIVLRESLQLSKAIREQYVHQAHWLIEADQEHLREYAVWLEQVNRRTASLRTLVPATSRKRLNRVERQSQKMDALFRSSLMPAKTSGDTSAVAALHKQADRLSSSASRHADEIALALATRIARTHVSATRVTELALLNGVIGVSLVLIVAVGCTVALRRVVIMPLYVISDAARKFGSGDFTTRIGKVGAGELRAVAETFDRMVEELETRERLLVENERMAAIGQVAAGVAHELNNPIQIIRGYLKTMSASSTPEELAEELKIIDDEANACQRIADDLVTYARTPDLRQNTVSMKELLVESVRRLRGSHGVDQPVDVNAEDAQIVADSDRLRQVLVNLLLNAAQASPNGAPIEVSGRASIEGGYEIRVADRGPGVRPEHRSRIFEPFFSERPGGSGLGLSVCRGIVRAHGGVIELEDRPDGGTIFVVRLQASPPSRQSES